MIKFILMIFSGLFPDGTENDSELEQGIFKLGYIELKDILEKISEYCLVIINIYMLRLPKEIE